MKLNEDRIGHIVRGSLYLASAGENLKAYKEECRRVYGDLRGVKFVKVKGGTDLMAPSLPVFGWGVPYKRSMEVLK
jgi:hypothetical protein